MSSRSSRIFRHRKSATRESLGMFEDDSPKFAGVAVSILTITSNYTITDQDSFIKADATSGNITVTLPPAAIQDGRGFYIKKIDVSANTVTIQADGAELIDGANTKVISSQYVSYTVITDGAEWSIS